MASVLEGVRVLDLSWGVAGPVAGMLLSDHGAEVIKIEPPGGDPFRGTPGYEVWLRGRQSVTIDLADDSERLKFWDLVDGADVVLDSFAPGVLDRFDLGGNTIVDRNPAVIHCSITGYGDHASHRDRPGYEALVAARTGMWHVQRGELGGAVTYMHDQEPFLPDLEIPEGMEPGSPRPGPIFTYTPWLSMGAALLASVGINAALLARLRTGRGQRVQTSLLQAALSATASKWLRVGNPDAKGFRSWIYDQRAPKGFFQCSDGRWIEQWVPNPQFALSSADGHSLALRRDVDRALNDPDRIEPDPENIVVLAHYYPLMRDAFARFPSNEWVEVGRQGGVPLQPVRTPEEALDDPALLAEEAVVDVPHPEHGSLRQAGILYGLSATPGRIQGPPPAPGQHTESVVAHQRRHPNPPPAPADGRPPLDGVTVLDLGFAVAGPFGTQVLADLGANVIKVNAWRDPFWHSRHIAYGCNRGKRSIGIDLKTVDGLAVFHRLLEKADVVHSNMRRDALSRLKCDEKSLRAINPDIIYCHTRGFDRGPRSNSPGNDQTGCSLAGVTWEDGGCRDGGKPFWSMTSLGDTGNGFLSAIGVMQALYHRALTGEAQSVDTSILNAGLLVASMAALKPDGTPLPRPELDRMQLGLSAFYRIYQARDGWVCVAAITPEHQARLAKVTRVESSDFATLEPWFAGRSASEAWTVLDGGGVPCEICDGEFGRHIYADPEMHARELVVRQEHPKLGSFEHFGKTITFSGTPERIYGPPPVCGQHTREILHEHGFEDAEIDKLVDARAIFEERWVD